jgi:tetratricopeptide (TPR) repeat protein
MSLMPAQGSTPVKRNRGQWLLAGVAAAALVGAGAFVLWPRSASPHPKPTVAAPTLTSSPFLNTKPGIAYVGDEVCADCHARLGETYHQHPMGRSLFRAADAPPLEQYDAKANNPFQVGAFHFQVIRQGARMIHKEWCQDAQGVAVAELREEITYAVGAGSQGRSYFYGRDGFLFESPITWYSLNSRWQLSPGYAENLVHFSRRIDSRCLYCHSQEARPVENTINRYQEPPFGQLAIGCERCHGPGQLHVAERKQGPPPDNEDLTIVNPRRLAPALREAVCEQCHLQGEAAVVRRGRMQTDYRPGLPLQEYVSIFVRPPEVEDARRIVGHVEQMHQSACFVKSGGKFGCTSCHDPHRSPPPAEKFAFYQQRCRNCHGSEPPPSSDAWVKAPDCSVPLAERTAANGRDDCLACHMPRNPSTTASHLAVTDHRVLRRPDHPRTMHSDFQPGDIPLIPFHRDPPDAKDEEAQRDLAVAAVRVAEPARKAGAAQISRYLTQRALPLLNQAAARAPDDVPALEAQGFALFDQGRLDEAQKALDDALALAPDREQTLTWAVQTAAARGRFDLAERYCRRLVEKYPLFPLHHESLAFVLVKQKKWAESLEEAKVAVTGNPFRAEARELLITALLETGGRDRAQSEFDALGVINPSYQAKLRPRYEEQLKRLR